MQKNIWIAAKYLRLSIEDGDKAESESIVNQSILIDNYMKSTSDITIVETFKDDGFQVLILSVLVFRQCSRQSKIRKSTVSL